MGSLSLHGAIGASLFLPVEQNMRLREIDKEEPNENSPLFERATSIQTTNECDENNLSLWKKIESSMDLMLLKDPRFMILNIGLACTYTVSVDFTLILPFFLQVSLRVVQKEGFM